MDNCFHRMDCIQSFTLQRYVCKVTFCKKDLLLQSCLFCKLICQACLYRAKRHSQHKCRLLQAWDDIKQPCANAAAKVRYPRSGGRNRFDLCPNAFIGYVESLFKRLRTIRP